MNVIRWMKLHRPSAPAALLFTALLAQAPHAAAVFARVAPHGAAWEQWASVVGAIVYAIALESATAYFVWRNQRKWAIAFAVFSIAHNVAYYMPAEWTLVLWNATLQWRNVVGSVLISISLPIAIAAFSHVQAHSGAAGKDAPDHSPAKAAGRPQEGRNAAVMDTTTTITVSEETGADGAPSVTGNTPPEAAETEAPRLTPAQRRAHIAEQELADPAQVAAQFGVSLRTAQLDIAQVRRAATQANGKVHA